MYADSELTIPYEDIDSEIRELCRALNSIDGIETVESCCGHGKDVCRIWFKVKDILTFNKLLFHCFNGCNSWTIKAYNADPHRDWNDLHFVLECNCVESLCYLANSLTERLRREARYVQLSDCEWRELRNYERWLYEE